MLLLPSSVRRRGSRSRLIGWSIENFSFTPVVVAVAFTPAIVMALVLVFVPQVRQIHVSAEPKTPASPQQAEQIRHV